MADILWENRITDKNKIQDRFMFHRTKKTKIKDILQNGFKPRKSAKQEKKDERFLKKIAEVERSELLVDRTVSSFFYPQYGQVKGSFGGHLGTGVIVVDSSVIHSPTFVADMDLYDSVISHTPRDDLTIQKVNLLVNRQQQHSHT